MAYETILYDVADGVATITLNRPDVLNAFNKQMTEELQDVLKTAERDRSVRCLVLTGAGRAFSSGEDLKARQASGATFGDTLRLRYNPTISRMRNLDKPITRAINGPA